jgi:hypothetical protein
MEKQSIENGLLALERMFWQAIVDKNASAAKRLTDDPCVIAGAQGVSSVPAEAIASMVEGASYRLKSFELSDDAQVRMLNDDVAILAYRVREELEVDGEPLTLEAADTSTWVRRNGDWVCALHTEALAGDPFGRDRAPRG